MLPGPARRCAPRRRAGQRRRALPWGGRRERLPLHWPFAEAVEGYRAKALANPSSTRRSTFVWGQMMAVGMVEMLQVRSSETFGADGHDGCAAGAGARRAADRRARWSPASRCPPDLTPAEVASLFASWVNEVCYASVESPDVDGDRAGFDIHYCPHEDVYGAFDCRIQRYLVEGMIGRRRRTRRRGVRRRVHQHHPGRLEHVPLRSVPREAGASSMHGTSTRNVCAARRCRCVRCSPSRRTDPARRPGQELVGSVTNPGIQCR